MAWLGWFLVEYLSSDFILLVLAAIKNVIKIHSFIEHSKEQWNRDCDDPPSNPRFTKVASTSCTASRVSLLSQTSEAYWSLMTQTENYQQLFSSLLTHYTLPKLIFFFFGSRFITSLHIYINFDKVWKEQSKYLSKVSYDKCGCMWHLLKCELIRKCGVGPTCYAARVGRGKLLWVCVSSCLGRIVWPGDTMEPSPRLGTS